jgi:hypothetical protein
MPPCTRQVVHRHDEGARHTAQAFTWWRSPTWGARTLVIVPMLKEDQFLGAIMMYRQRFVLHRQADRLS